MTRRVLVARSDNCGDVILAGPAVRAVAQHADAVLLAGPRGEAAARLLPCVSEVAVLRLPWIDLESGPWVPGDGALLVRFLEKLGCDEALILTSFHQSPLPLALLMREAGVARITAASEDYPGTLLDVRSRPDTALHEVERNLAVSADAGYLLPPDDDGRLRVRPPSAPPVVDVDVVVHPGATAPTRGIPTQLAAAAVRELTRHGLRVAVTGSARERSITAAVAGDAALDLGGRTSLGEVAAILRAARAVVCGNTGIAHLAAAVATPVISFFAPVVGWSQWRPYGVPAVRLGDQTAPCAGTRARECPVPGHPCVSSVRPRDVLDAVLAQPVGAS